MITARRLKRDANIVRLYEDGIGCQRISELVKVNAPRVRSILKAKGYQLGMSVGHAEKGKPSIWERDPDPHRLRREIWDRARSAARLALQGAK